MSSVVSIFDPHIQAPHATVQARLAADAAEGVAEQRTVGHHGVELALLAAGIGAPRHDPGWRSRSATPYTLSSQERHSAEHACPDLAADPRAGIDYFRGYAIVHDGIYQSILQQSRNIP